MIKRFKITKLFGFRDVSIPFDSDIKILIGENGLGKTTILNSLYYVLSEKYYKLNTVEFERIELVFRDGNKIQFTKRDLESYVRFQERQGHRGIPTEVLKKINLQELEQFINNDTEAERDSEHSIMRYISKYKTLRWAPLPIMAREIRFLIDEPVLKKFIQFSDVIKSFSIDILYFPTYRRVEEDLKNLGKFRKKLIDPDFDDTFIEEIEEDFQVSDDTLIHFGMEDVEQRIDKVKTFINNSTVDGFSKVTGEILSQLLLSLIHI